jgi:hypothetical protein
MPATTMTNREVVNEVEVGGILQTKSRRTDFPIQVMTSVTKTKKKMVNIRDIAGD